MIASLTQLAVVRQMIEDRTGEGGRLAFNNGWVDANEDCAWLNGGYRCRLKRRESRQPAPTRPTATTLVTLYRRSRGNCWVVRIRW